MAEPGANVQTDGSGAGPSAPRLTPRRRPGPVAVLAAACLLLLVTWSSAALAAGNPTVAIGTSATFGQILTDAQGMAMYTYSGDHSGIGTCTGSCAAVWPPLTVPSGTTPSAGPGVPGSVAAVPQPNGTDQVTYDGSPLYGFVGDSSPGQVTGNGVSGFSVVKVTAAAPAPTTTTPAPSAPTTSATTPPPSTATSPSTSSASPGVTTAVPPSPTSVRTAPAAVSPATAAQGATLAMTGPGRVFDLLMVLGLALTAFGALLYAAAQVRRRRPREG